MPQQNSIRANESDQMNASPSKSSCHGDAAGKQQTSSSKAALPKSSKQRSVVVKSQPTHQSSLSPPNGENSQSRSLRRSTRNKNNNVSSASQPVGEDATAHANAEASGAAQELEIGKPAATEEQAMVEIIVGKDGELDLIVSNSQTSLREPALTTPRRGNLAAGKHHQDTRQGELAKSDEKVLKRAAA